MEFAKQRFGFDADHGAVPEHRAIGRRPRRRSCRARASSRPAPRLPLIKDGKLRALAVSSSTMLPLLPEVPPFCRSGGCPGLRGGVLARAARAGQDADGPIVERLHAEMKKIMADPTMKEKAAAIGLIPIEYAVDRGHPGLHLKSERDEVGRAGREARAEGHAIGRHAGEGRVHGRATAGQGGTRHRRRLRRPRLGQRPRHRRAVCARGRQGLRRRPQRSGDEGNARPQCRIRRQRSERTSAT